MATNPDFTYTQGSTTIWSLFEMNLGIACVCMTRLKPFLRKHLPRLISSFSHSNNIASKGPYQRQNKMPSNHGSDGARRRSVERRSGRMFKSNDDRIMSTSICVKNKIEVRYDDRPSVANKDGSTENILRGGSKEPFG
ncbi:MFS transporter [Apiospora kogelbergensis]|uniref:MFS transporter n=1 Tax=Apiospora kogelbergensis TaxID=1337665 RepID=A0AAW0QQ51_9PEZI